MFKNFFLIFSIILLGTVNVVYGQDATVFNPDPAVGVRSDRNFDSIDDQGWYWLNSMYLRWSYFGAYYQTRLYYRLPIFRDQNSFWFADSAFMVGIEQDIGPFERTSLYLFWQPVIALAFEMRMGYEQDVANYLKPVEVDGADADYNFALPPFTGQNPNNKTPNYQGGKAFILEFTPTLTMGGSIGDGMLALIYSPIMTYVKNFQLHNDKYYFYGRDIIVMLPTDIYWKHNIKLGYNFTGTGMSMAVISIIEHVQSSGRLMRAGLFGGFNFEKQLKKYPNLIPFFRAQVGSWLSDEYLKGDFAIGINGGLIWKFT